MATSLALRRATTVSLLSKLLNPVRSATVSSPSVSRSFAANTQLVDNIGGDDLGTVDVDRRSSPRSSLYRRRDRDRDRALSSGFFPDVVDPFSPTRTVSQLLNLMDQFVDTPLLGSPRMGGTAWRGWDVKEDEKALYLSMDMPGLGKEDVKVAIDQNTLVIKGEGPKESEGDESGRRYSSRLDLPPNVYKIDDIKAEMKNGVLKVVVPRVKEEERSDVVEVKVE